MADQGVISLRYDKLTTGKTGLGSYASHPNDINYPQFVQGARAAYDFLKNRSEVDPDRLMLLGHSEGGATALVIAEQLKSGGGPKLLMLAASIARPIGGSGYFYQPLKIASDLSPALPVLIICGEKDTIVSCSEVKSLAQAFEDAGNKNVSFYKIANMNHVFKDITGTPSSPGIEYAALTLKFSTEFISRMTAFIKTKL